MTEEGPDPSTAVAATDADSTLLYFPVSLRKLVVMSISTLGLYTLYWQFCHWLYIRDYEDASFSPGWRGFFAIIFCYPLFRRIRQTARSKGLPVTLPAGPLAFGWLIFAFLGSLPPPFFLLYFLSVLFLLPVQNAANAINSITDPDHDPNDSFSTWNKVAIGVGGITLALAVVGSFLPPK